MFDFCGKPFYITIKSTFKYYFKRRPKYEPLHKYSGEIIILSVFLFIASSLMITDQKEKTFDFVKKPYKWIYQRGIMGKCVDCSIRYLRDQGIIDEDDYDSDDYEIGSFDYQYTKDFLEPYNLSIDMNKYSEMLGLVLNIHTLYEYVIPKKTNRVLDLVKCVSRWKKLALELFKSKSEYILFLFLVNLSR